VRFCPRSPKEEGSVPETLLFSRKTAVINTFSAEEKIDEGIQFRSLKKIEK
tara:strand:- start:666 stop:818 length:153 start_codon:yes stop_codon:yes gene_type:complete